MHFKFTTAGESHGPALVTIIEGIPAGLPVDKALIDRELWRRQQGYGRGGRMKIETDQVKILSGVRHGRAIGSPIALMIENRDHVHWLNVMSAEPLSDAETEKSPESSDADADTSSTSAPYAVKSTREVKRPRPGHADLAGGQKYQARDLRNILERASARETAARVAAGAVAKQLLAYFGVEVRSHVAKLGSIPSDAIDADWQAIKDIGPDSQLNCADPEAEAAMIQHIDDAKERGDTLGGIFEVVAKGVPVGLGSHTSWEDKLDGRIARAVMSIHAVKAVEIGSGVANAARPGSDVHDEIYFEGSEADVSGFRRRTNRAGGLEGGITNGEEIRVRGYLKPIATLKKPLHSVDIDTKEPSPAAFERSDVTAVPAAGVIGEAMLAIVLANAMREKFGGDSIDEMFTNFNSYNEAVNKY